MKMLKNYMNFCRQNHLKLQNIIKTASLTTSPVHKWDLFAAVCVERKPILTQKLNSLEDKFVKYLNEMEFRRSMKSEHEIRHEQELLQAELLKKGETSDLDLDTTTKQTAQDFEDACIEELSKFKFADCITDADKKNNVTSLERKLRNHLVLLIEHQIGNAKHFILPQVLRQDGETMRQTAERALSDSCGANLKVKFFGNAPNGFYKYRYPKGVKGDTVGAKVFIYIARHLEGQVKKDQKYKWLDRLELKQQLPDEYFENVNNFLIDEYTTEENLFRSK